MGLGLQPRMRYTRLDNLDKRGIVVVIFNSLVKIVLKKYELDTRNSSCI